MMSADEVIDFGLWEQELGGRPEVVPPPPQSACVHSDYRWVTDGLVLCWACNCYVDQMTWTVVPPEERARYGPDGMRGPGY